MIRVLAVLAVAAVAPAVGATPAHAHGLGGTEPTNVETRIVAVEPAVEGVEIEAVDLGRSVELRVTAARDVTVLGYEGEPYLRVGPDGVFENARSPAVFQNRSLDPPADVPARYDASAPPEWERVGDGATVRWHDHRAHYMGSGAFAGVRAFEIPMTIDGREVVARGEMRWVDPPAWWRWALVAVATALVVVLASRVSYRLAAVLALTALVVGEVVHVAGSWELSGDSFAGRAGAQALSFTAVALGVVAIARLQRRGAHAAAPWVLVAAIALLVAGGLADLSAWYRSQLPSDLEADAVRALVALALGAGAGLVVASASRIAPAPGSAPDPERTGGEPVAPGRA
jgi:hypothetical protein